MSEPTANSDAEATATPAFRETYTSAAVDGARIGCVTAAVLASLDGRLDPEQRETLIEYIEQAREWLDAARAVLAVEPTSVHIVRPGGGGIILPP